MANNVLLASDNFASGFLAAGWTAMVARGFTSLPKVVAGTPNFIEENALSTVGSGYWSALSWPNDHCSEITINALTAELNTEIDLVVRYQTSTNGPQYFAILTNGTAQLFYRDSSAGFTSLTTALSVTISPGDIFTLQAAGSCISLYKNFQRILFASDTNLTGGFPGLFLFSSVNVAHAQIASWRGYNVVQQDGIWQKQSIVLAPLAADLASAGIGVYEGCAIYDSNPQILVGPNVYKLWFSAGPHSSSSVNYAESPDLVNWTRHSGAVLANIVTPGVIKVGSTYHLYGQATSLPGSGATQHFTSPDGVNWTLQSANVFATGAYPLKPIAIVNGTWYALWGVLGNKPGDFAEVYMASSPDGVTWTAYAGNPVISAQSTYPYPCVAKVGNTFYVWMQAGPSAPQSSAASRAFDPTECIRYSTTDFINWALSSHSLHHSQGFEALNCPTDNVEAVGGLAPVAIFDINGKATMLYIMSQGDSVGPQVAQYSVAVATAPIASIVTQKEDAVAQVATDPFTSGLGDLSANWTLPTGGTKLKIVAGPYAESTVTSTVCQAVYTGASFNANQYSEVTLQALTGTLAQSLIWPTVRSSISALTNYEARIASPSATEDAAAAIYKRVAGTPVQIGPTGLVTPTVGDVWRLSVFTGSDGFPVLSLFQNGSLILQVQDQSSTPIISGNPGIQAFSSVAIADAQMSSWAGGNANVIPNYLTGVNWSPVDCRDFATFPNTGVVQSSGAVFYTGQTSSNPALPPVDSNPALPAKDSRIVIPTNSRNNPPF